MPIRNLRKANQDGFNNDNRQKQKTDKLYYDYENNIDNISERNFLMSTTLEIKRFARGAVQHYINIGKKLKLVKEQLLNPESRFTESKFKDWVDSEFNFSDDTALNYINLAVLAEEKGEDFLIEVWSKKKVDLSALYIFARYSSTAALEAAVDAVDNNEEIDKIKKQHATRIVEQYREHNLQETKLAPELIALLIQSPVSEDRKELDRLEKIAKKRQREVTSLIINNPDLTIKEAEKTVRTQERQQETINISAIAITVNEPSVPIKFDARQYQGEWYEMLDDGIEPESINFCFVDFPLGKKTLDMYKVLSEKLYPLMAHSGIVLATVGHQNLQFVGSYMEPFKVGWTLALIRQNGYSPRQVGLNFFNSWIPLGMYFKSPYNQDKFMDDLFSLSYGQESSLETTYQRMQLPVQNNNENNEGRAIEMGIAYYMKQIIKSGDTIMYLTGDRDKHNMKIDMSFIRDIASQSEASKLMFNV